jgi:hypothetical protein
LGEQIETDRNRILAELADLAVKVEGNSVDLAEK